MGQKAKHNKTVTLQHKDENGKVTYQYQFLKNTKSLPEKLQLKKYNPVTRKHELFVETKSKN
ncbi:50S ribosomal protein L33 [Candidatus Peregrinibacteria bacterium]|nr:50S ribosomal protein L33 [Candidatus Peregrinibacteria bacterium]